MYEGRLVADSEGILGRGTIIRAYGVCALVQWDNMEEPMWTRWTYLDLI